MVMALLAFGGCTDQSSEKPLSERTLNIPSADDSPPERKAAVVEISGIVEQTSDGFVLNSESGAYLVAGEDLAAVVGKAVVISGAVEETSGRRLIQVDSVRMTE
jgi:hypothetical protein